MKPYIQTEKHKGRVKIVNDENLPSRFRKLVARLKRDERRERRSQDKQSLRKIERVHCA